MTYSLPVTFFGGPNDGATVVVAGPTGLPPVVIRVDDALDGVYWQSEENRQHYFWEFLPEGETLDSVVDWHEAEYDVDEPDGYVDNDDDDDGSLPNLTDVMRVLAEYERVRRSKAVRRNHPSTKRYEA